ncbi:MAG TPA: sigma-70 family RNA polymerase sigma factor [Candidatus Dormibacteraeota bacterium]|nr:sigma-70 family RNA polymerase sigma factor [Candidatus Dormibacteraeota bacterium]
MIDEACDASLLARAAAGEAAAFDPLVGRWKNRLYRLALRFFRRPEDAEEIVQEVFMKVYRMAASYRSDAPFEHWLLRIATNTCVDRLRERRRRREDVLADITPDSGVWLDAALAGASQEARQAEAARVLASDLLDSLAPKDRMVLVLMDLEGLSAREVATAVGSTRAAVKVRALRARRSLRRLAEAIPPARVGPEGGRG